MANRTPSQYNLIELSIINFNGNKIDIKPALMQLDIHADLFNSCLHGSLEIRDNGDFQQNIPLIGEETLYVKMQVDNTRPKFEFLFYIYQLADKNKIAEDTFTYTLYFTSREMMNNQKTSLSESFYKLNVGTLVDKVFAKVSDKKLDREQISNVVEYIAPNISPFEIINYMGTRSISTQYPNSGGMLFFEDINGFKFKSIDFFMKQPVKANYSFNHKQQATTNIDIEYYSISKWQIPQHYNILDNLDKGLYGSTTWVLDPFTRKYTKKVYNYFNDADYNKTSHIEQNPKHRLHTSKFGFKSAPDSFNKFRMSYNENDKENILGIRYSQLNQISNSYQLVIEVPGNTDILVGDILDINYLNYSSDNDAKPYDMFLRGKYMVTATRHILTQAEYHMVIELAKDSYYSDHEEYNRIGLI